MLLPVYDRPPITIDRGEGCYLWDTDGNRYLDFITGIGVNALGHAHPRIVQAMTAQASRCLHNSNLFRHSFQEDLAKRLAEWSGLPYVFFSNSGSEAMETALKAARAASNRRAIVALENGFHGRTMGALAITWPRKYREPFEPLPGDVTFVPANDGAALRRAVSEQTLAVVLEPVQGEGGIHPLEEGYLREVQSLCRQYGAFWIADETQCGIGRTGFRFAYQRFQGLQPDVITTAKPLGAGVPMGATMLAEHVARLTSGQHGSTFGGGPLACRIALEVLETVDELLPSVRELGSYLLDRLKAFGEVRGAGLMAGLEVGNRCGMVVDHARQRGLLVNRTAGSVLRLLPPYVATRAHVDEAIQTIRNTLTAS